MSLNAWLIGPVAFKPLMTWYIVVGVHGGGNSWQPRVKEKGRE